MSIGYRKEGFDTHVVITNNGTVAFGTVPVSKHLQPGFYYFYADPKTTYLTSFDVDISTLTSSAPITLDFYVKDRKICTGQFTRSADGRSVWYVPFSNGGSRAFFLQTR